MEKFVKLRLKRFEKHSLVFQTVEYSEAVASMNPQTIMLILQVYPHKVFGNHPFDCHYNFHITL